MRQPEWQTKVARTSTKAIIKGALALQKASERDEHRSGTTTAVTSRKNSETTHSTINSKKMTPKKFKLVATSSYFFSTLLQFFFIFFGAFWSATPPNMLNFVAGFFKIFFISFF